MSTTNPSASSDRLWYAFRTDTDHAQLVGPEYMGTAGWHPDTATGQAAALKRAQLWYYWVPADALTVGTNRPAELPASDPSNTIPGWVHPLSVGPNDRPAVTERNLQLIAEWQRRRNDHPIRPTNNETRED